VNAQESMREHAAAKEGAKLLLDEARGRLLSVCGAREKTFELLANDLVKQSLLRLMALVLGHAVPDRDRVGESAEEARADLSAWHEGDAVFARGRVSCDGSDAGCVAYTAMRRQSVAAWTRWRGAVTNGHNLVTRTEGRDSPNRDAAGTAQSTVDLARREGFAEEGSATGFALRPAI
jgi:hypothetical protein